MKHLFAKNKKVTIGYLFGKNKYKCRDLEDVFPYRLEILVTFARFFKDKSYAYEGRKDGGIRTFA